MTLFQPGVWTDEDELAFQVHQAKLGLSIDCICVEKNVTRQEFLSIPRGAREIYLELFRTRTLH